MDLRILPPEMGRKRKASHEVRATVSFRILPLVDKRLAALTEARGVKSKSAMAEILLREALDVAAMTDTDPQMKELLTAWSALTFEDRDRLIKTAQSWVAQPPAKPQPAYDPFEDMHTYHDGPPDDPRDFWERHKK